MLRKEKGSTQINTQGGSRWPVLVFSTFYSMSACYKTVLYRSTYLGPSVMKAPAPWDERGSWGPRVPESKAQGLWAPAQAAPCTKDYLLEPIRGPSSVRPQEGHKQFVVCGFLRACRSDQSSTEGPAGAPFARLSGGHESSTRTTNTMWAPGR